MILQGKAWKIGDNVRAQEILLPKYGAEVPDWPPEECAKYLLSDIIPDFAASCQPGDIIVGGVNMGSGHVHYHNFAIKALKAAGVSLFADSLDVLFMRNAIDMGLPAWSSSGISALVNTGDRLEFKLKSGEARNLTSGASAEFKPTPQIILDILTAGGNVPWALQRAGYTEK